MCGTRAARTQPTPSGILYLERIKTRMGNDQNTDISLPPVRPRVNGPNSYIETADGKKYTPSSRARSRCCLF